MVDIVMSIGIVVFFILFGFLALIFGVAVISLVKPAKKLKRYYPQITVAIPAYNEEKNIRECLQSIKSCIYPKGRVEIVVIDDGSMDCTSQIANQLGVKVIAQNHSGKVDALNLALKNASGKVLVTVDADAIVDKNFLRFLVRPFQDSTVGATSGAVNVKNKHTIAGIFQNVEYHYNNLIRHSFSKVFGTGIWFFGCFAAYRISTLREIGGFKKDSLTEDMDIAMELRDKGYHTVDVAEAFGHTVVPETFKGLFKQRSRWWIGGIQSLRKNKHMVKLPQNPTVLFIFVNHFWWSIYSFLSLPIILYQVNYWLPTTGLWDSLVYLFRWFTLTGPFYVLYKIPEWGVSSLNIFGVLSGVITAAMIIIAVKLFKDRFGMRNLVGLFLYFPYTIILNMFVAASVLLAFRRKNGHFVK